MNKQITHSHLTNLFVAVLCIAYFFVLNSIPIAPTDFYPDEIGKIRQILGETRNFYHPQFLVEANHWINYVSNNTSVPMALKLARWFSNALAVLTALLFGLAIKHSSRSQVCFSATVVLFILSTPLLLAGHYIKEDIYLFFSLALNSYAIALFIFGRGNDQQNDAERFDHRAVLIGVSCGLLVSSKYAAIGYCAAQMMVLFFNKENLAITNKTFIRIGFFGFATFLALNTSIFFHPHQFYDGLQAELRHAQTGHGALSWPWYSSAYIIRYYKSLSGTGFLLLLVLYASGFKYWKIVSSNHKQFFWLTLIPSAVYFVLLQVAPLKLGARYIHPLTLTTVFAGLLLSSAIYTANRTYRVVFYSATGFLALAFLSSSLAIYNSTHRISQTSIDKWLDSLKNGRPQKIISDNYSGLYLSTRRPWPPENSENSDILFVDDVARYCLSSDCTVFSYQVISCRTFTRYFESSAQLTPDGKKYREYYRALIESKTPVFITGEVNHDFFDLGVMEEQCVLAY